MRNVVICADGTGNSFDTNVSNVTRLVKSLVFGGPEKQLVIYDQGVGTERSSVEAAHAFANNVERKALKILDGPTQTWWPANLVARIAGLGFGYGLRDNIGEMYEELSKAYCKDAEPPRIFLFGFSRGAFTVRALAGFIRRCGLLPPDKIHLFHGAFDRLYNGKHLETMTPEEQEELTGQIAEFRKESRCCHIHFLGLWDTVKSYGFVYPKSLPHLRHNPRVGIVRHALALNERRSYYQFTSWGGVDHPLYSDDREGDTKDVKEVWFAGDHADVGGGHSAAENGLSRAPFEWMIAEARANGLQVCEEELASVLKDFSSKLSVHDLLRRWWWIAEFFPRFELENIPFPGKRVLKWGSTGHRKPFEVARGNRISVHASAVRVLAQANSALVHDRIDIVPETPARDEHLA